MKGSFTFRNMQLESNVNENLSLLIYTDSLMIEANLMEFYDDSYEIIESGRYYYKLNVFSQNCLLGQFYESKK